MGWRLIVVTSRELFRAPAHTIERVGQALRERGARVPRRCREGRSTDGVVLELVGGSQ